MRWCGLVQQSVGCRAAFSGTNGVPLPILTLFTKKYVRYYKKIGLFEAGIHFPHTPVFEYSSQEPCSLCDEAKEALAKYQSQVGYSHLWRVPP